MSSFEIYLVSLLYLTTILIFTSCVFFSIYIITLFIWSKGFSISPTVTSNSKSIKKIAEYIAFYCKNNPNERIRILDIGSGYGSMLFKINNSLKNDMIEYVGYEIAKFPYKISNFLNKSKNIIFINDDINKLKDFKYNFIITFILKKQQKLFLNIYRNFPKESTIIANSLPIPFEKDDKFKLVDTIRVHYGWNIYIYHTL